MNGPEVRALVEQLREARVAAEVSRETVAREIGVSASTVRRWEDGESVPRGLNAVALQKYVKRHAADAEPYRVAPT
jgi:DNA-binding transcriptional regulator YiaG